MAIYKTEAIVLKSRKQGETSKIVTVFSRLFGKQSLMAKGSRNIKSKYLGVLEPLNYIRVIIYRKETRELQYISQAEIIEHFPSIHEQLGKIALAAIPCEIIDKTENPEHANPRLFQLLLDTLRALEKADTGLRNIIRAFQLRFIDLSGFHPDFSHCSLCEKEEIDGFIYFMLDKGAYACQQCDQVSEAAFQLSGKALEYLRWLQTAPLWAAHRAKMSARIGKEIDNFLLTFMRYHIDNLKYLKSIDHLDKLQAGLQSLQ